MGLFTALVTLPLAPVRGVVWVAEQVADEAERQHFDESRIRSELLRVELDHEAGLVDEQEYGEQVEVLLERLSRAREIAGTRQGPRWESEEGDG